MSDLRSVICAAHEDAWTAAEGRIDGRPSTVRFRPALSRVLGHPALPKRLLISWDYGDDGETGMPQGGTPRQLDAFESALQAALDPDRIAVLACVFTHVGTREWHYYFNDIDQLDEKINEALADQPDLPISIKAFDDPEWSELAALLESIRDDFN